VFLRWQREIVGREKNEIAPRSVEHVSLRLPPKIIVGSSAANIATGLAVPAHRD